MRRPPIGRRGSPRRGYGRNGDGLITEDVAARELGHRTAPRFSRGGDAHAPPNGSRAAVRQSSGGRQCATPNDVSSQYCYQHWLGWPFL